MNTTAKKILIILLDDLADKASNAGSNDMFLQNNPENVEFVKAMIASGDYPDESVNEYEDQLLMNDFEVIYYIRELVLEEIEKETEKQK